MMVWKVDPASQTWKTKLPDFGAETCKMLALCEVLHAVYVGGLNVSWNSSVLRTVLPVKSERRWWVQG